MGGSGGGGSSGKVDYPTYMKTIHVNMMTGAADEGSVTGLFGASNNLLAKIAAAEVTSPFTGEDAYDPDGDITAFLAALSTYQAAVVGFSELWSGYATDVVAEVDANIIEDATLSAATSAHGAKLDDRLTTDVLPRFQTGMRDMNSVVSSSFVIGQAVLEGFNTREVADFDAKIRLNSYGQRVQVIAEGIKDAIGLAQSRVQYEDAVVKTTVETYRIKAVLKKEELAEHLDIIKKDYTWGIDLFQHGSNALGSISGSAINAGGGGPSTFQSALGGAMSGAAAGAAIGYMGGPWGVTAGAVGGALVGGLGGLLS